MTNLTTANANGPVPTRAALNFLHWLATDGPTNVTPRVVSTGTVRVQAADRATFLRTLEVAQSFGAIVGHPAYSPSGRADVAMVTF